MCVDAGGVRRTCRSLKLLLMKAQEIGSYVTDITRSWPVNGRFTDSQRDMYNMILEVQKDVVALCREDASTTLDGLHRAAETGLRDGLRRLGFDMSRGVRAFFSLR